MKKIILILAILISSSCQNNDGNSLRYPYYQFSDNNNDFIISYNYMEGEVLTYKNQDNQTLRFKVIEIIEGRTNQYSRGTFSGGGGILEAYFDRKIIRLEIIENGTNYSCCDQINYVFSKREDVFKVGFKLPLWNKTSSTIIDEVQNPIDISINTIYNYQGEAMELNNVIYNNVLKFESELMDEYNKSTNLEIYVNEIFYDLNFGIIQFNDINGMQWKLTME